MPAVTDTWWSLLTRTRDTLPGFDARSGFVESFPQVFGGVIVIIAPHLAGSSLSIPFADRMSSRRLGEGGYYKVRCALLWRRTKSRDTLTPTLSPRPRQPLLAGRGRHATSRISLHVAERVPPHVACSGGCLPATTHHTPHLHSSHRIVAVFTLLQS